MRIRADPDPQHCFSDVFMRRQRENGCRICQTDYPSSRKCRISGQNYTSILTNGGTSSTGKRQNVQLFSSYYEESNISDVDPLC